MNPLQKTSYFFFFFFCSEKIENDAKKYTCSFQRKMMCANVAATKDNDEQQLTFLCIAYNLIMKRMNK